MCVCAIVTVQDVQCKVSQIKSNRSCYNLFSAWCKRKTFRVLIFQDYFTREVCLISHLLGYQTIQTINYNHCFKLEYIFIAPFNPFSIIILFFFLFFKYTVYCFYFFGDKLINFFEIEIMKSSAENSCIFSYCHIYQRAAR